LKTLQIITALFVITILPTTAFAETQMDTDPFATGSQFDSKPLDEHQQDEQDMTDLWITCIVIVACLLIARIAFQIVKRRMKKSN
jgi:Ca2+/H+ antiporter